MKMTIVELNRVFTIERNGRKGKYKIINHPFFDNVFALVREHQLIHMQTKTDEKYIIAGSPTIEKAYEAAYYAT